MQYDNIVELPISKKANSSIINVPFHASSASAKGKLFADCLKIGENWAKKMQPKIR